MVKLKFTIFIFFSLALQYACKIKPLSLDRWQYVVIDTTRTGNDLMKNWGWFGMDFADGNHDGFGDIVAGKWFYLNPGGDMSSQWMYYTIQDSVDNMFIVNIDDDQYTDIIGLRCNQQFWFEAENKEHTKWKATIIGNEPICNHKISSMGFCKADIFKGGKPELLFTDKPGKIWCFEIPDNPDTLWPVTIISENRATEKFISAGDIDGDGDLDLATGYQVADEKHYQGVCWFENPGNNSGNWAQHTIGQVDYTADHFAIADFNGDGICEILVTEGRTPEEYPAGIYLFSSPAGNIYSPHWDKTQIAVQYSTNSLEVADLDNDGDLDFVTGEHKGSCRLQIWENDGLANFKEHVIDSLKESHNGTKLFDIEGDGDMDIVTSGWYDRSVHLWINKAIN
jgi:hypothetical protein